MAFYQHREVASPPPEIDQVSIDQASMDRGEAIYAEKCAMCHQAAGLGVPPVFPPLAESDWLMEDRERAVKVLAEGLKKEIVVNGKTYDGAMPAQFLDDTQAADVMTFITNSWGNRAPAFTPEEVAEARKKSRYKTYEALVKAHSYQPLAKAPEGWVLEEVVRLDAFVNRLAGPDKDGNVYLLGGLGAVSRLNGKSLFPWLDGSYMPREGKDASACGITIGPDGRLWITSNQQFTAEDGMVYNDVNIWRSAEKISDTAPVMESWFQVTLPYGVGPYNHGVSHLAFGPDGALWVGSGSRTDSGEEGAIPNISKEGETEITACLWRFEVAFEEPTSGGPPEVYAKGIRNPYGFDWDDAGNLFTVSNGPDAHPAEEMDFIEKGAHYGFPFQFADHSAADRFYEHTPKAPEGLVFRDAVKNIGPDGGKGFATFTPHSCPGGMIWCGENFPEPLKNRFLMTRFGNLISLPVDSGFDVLSVKPFRNDEGQWQAEVHTILDNMGRPLDVVALADGSLLILEYSRITDQKSRLGMVPGRIVRLKPAE